MNEECVGVGREEEVRGNKMVFQRTRVEFRVFRNSELVT